MTGSAVVVARRVLPFLVATALIAALGVLFEGSGGSGSEEGLPPPGVPPLVGAGLPPVPADALTPGPTGTRRPAPGPIERVYSGDELDSPPQMNTASCRWPAYPPELRRLRIQGEVKLHGIVSAEGRLEDAVSRSGDDLLARETIKLLARCRFTPARRRGSLVAATIDLSVRFRPDR